MNPPTSPPPRILVPAHPSTAPILKRYHTPITKYVSTYAFHRRISRVLSALGTADRCVALSRLVFDFMSGEEFREEDGVPQVLADFFHYLVLRSLPKQACSLKAFRKAFREKDLAC